MAETTDSELEKKIEAERALGAIPTNEEIIALIPSRAVREHLVKISHQFSERDRYILRCFLAPKSDEELDSVFEKGRYVSVPHPFRRGDIVAAYGKHSVFQPRAHEGGYSLGIMRSFKDDAEWQAWDLDVRTRIRHITDFSDVATTVEFLQDDGSFSHDHPNPVNLEFARDVPDALSAKSARTKLLEAASDLLRGEGSIEYLEYEQERYTQSAEHLLELLEKLRGTLHDYEWKMFGKFRTLYFPDDFSPMQNLSSEQKEEAQELLSQMEFASRIIEHLVKDIAVPTKALSSSAAGSGKKRGDCCASELKPYEKFHLRRELDDIFLQNDGIQRRIKNFLETPDCPRRQFYQKRVERAVKRLSKFSDILFDTKRR